MYYFAWVVYLLRGFYGQAKEEKFLKVQGGGAAVSVPRNHICLIYAKGKQK